MYIYSLTNNIWFYLIVWAIIYQADYYLTIKFKRLYDTDLNRYMETEGSVELSPEFIEDVEMKRTFSLKFFKHWVISLLVIFILWWICHAITSGIDLFYAFFGALILRQVPILFRHIRNIFTAKLAHQGGLQGKIFYRRWMSLRLSAIELFCFSVFYLIIAIFSASWFFYGGAFGTLVVVIKNWHLATFVYKKKDQVMVEKDRNLNSEE